MQRRILSSVIIAFLFVCFLNYGCSKLDTTNIGSDLLPAVDNVNTFDTVLNINTTQGIFNDTTIVNRTTDHALGVISNDPLFGTTKADIFMQLKPDFYPYYLGNAGDTLVGLDSVVLCLSYKGFWGDSLPIHLEVREVTDAFFRDSVYLDRTVNVSPGTGSLLATKDVDPHTLSNYVLYNYGRDTISNQIRIKLPAAWANQLYSSDSSATGANNAFYSDSMYRHFYNGLAVLATTGNGLMYVNLADTSTRLEVNFKRRALGNANKTDSVYSSLKLNSIGYLSSGTPPPSSTANHIVRNRAGYPISNPVSTELYLQTSPGTYVNLNIPGLSTLSNRVIHRAELIVEQIKGGALDDKLSAPNFLYLDLRDTTVAVQWKPIYIDLSPTYIYDPDYRSGAPYFPTGGVDYPYFGGYIRSKTVPAGEIKYYNFNISRYVQQIVTKHIPNYDLRLYAPFSLNYAQYSPTFIPYSNNIAYGRVRVGSGTNPDYKLRLHIVYSKLK